MGGSSGGMHVTLLMISPAFGGLFHRVISESGTALCPKMMEKNTRIAYGQVLSATNCTSLDCLKQVKIF